jgi:hypothetical protein
MDKQKIIKELNIIETRLDCTVSQDLDSDVLEDLLAIDISFITDLRNKLERDES